MAKGDLDTGLLLKIMTKLGESRARSTWSLTTGYLMELVTTAEFKGQEALAYIDCHVDFLKETGYLRVSPQGPAYRGLELTAKGQMFVQPELAEFGKTMLPQVVKSLEDRIQVLTYPQEEKDGMLYRLRDAVAKQVPDLIAKVIVDLGAKIVSGGA